MDERLDELTDQIIAKEIDFIAIYFDENEKKFIVEVADLKLISSDIMKQFNEVKFELGEPLIELEDKIENLAKFEKIEGDKVFGGMPCGIVNSGYYGTVTSTFGRLSVEYGDKKCTAKLAIASNNHVLVKKSGTKIWAINHNTVVGKLKCKVPLNRSDLNIDFAQGEMVESSFVSGARILEIGQINKIAKVKKGSKIRKFGAKTGFTEGKVLGQTSIKVGKRVFYGVHQTTKKFSAPGDSGSAIIDSNNNWIGVLSWGTASGNGYSYFWAMHPASQAKESSASFEFEAD